MKACALGKIVVLRNQAWGRGGEGQTNVDIIKCCCFTRLHLQGKVARRAFAQESLKSVTSPTSVGLLTFWHTFFHIKICLRTGSRGTPLFYPLFYDRLGYLKQYRTYLGPKSGPKLMAPDARTPNGHTHIKNLRPPAQKPFGQLLFIQSNSEL